MGFGRFLKRTLIPGYDLYQLGKNISENGLKDGVKTYQKEAAMDFPGVERIYEAGKDDGKKEGYIDASNEYEAKLIKQASKFEEQKTVFQNQKEEFDNLLNKYEIYINQQESKISELTSEKRALLEMLKCKYESLLNKNFVAE